MVNDFARPDTFAAETSIRGDLYPLSQGVVTAYRDYEGKLVVSFSLRGPKGGFRAIEWLTPDDAKALAELLRRAALWCDEQSDEGYEEEG